MALDISTIRQIAFAGLSSTIVLITIAFYIKITNGLFIPRLPWDFIKHRTDPKYELERQIGKRFSTFVFSYIPPFFIGFLIILLLTYLS